MIPSSGVLVALSVLSLSGHGEWGRRPIDSTRIQAQIALSEYRAGVVHGVVCAANRAHGLRLRWLDQHISIDDRTSTEPLLTMATSGFGREASWQHLGPTKVQVMADRVLRQWPNLTEWWVNGAQGVEQGWLVPSRPPGTGPLALQVTVTGSAAESSSSGLTLKAASGRALSYNHLEVFDADGRRAPSRLRVGAGGFFVEVDDATSRYPLTIDPLVSATNWSAQSNQADAGFNMTVASAGDVNGDGFSDVLVGAPSFDNGEREEGRVFLYLGGVNGLGASQSWTSESNQAGAEFGRSIAGVGDINGDGFSDCLVGAPGYDDTQQRPDVGRALLFLGGPTGLSASAAWATVSNQAGSSFGASVAGAGDVNGDGFADVLVGAPLFDNGELNEGRAFLYLGSATGLKPSAAWEAEFNQIGADFGRSIAGAGDVNGDGYGDIIVGASLADDGEVDEGQALVYLGSATGLALNPAWRGQLDQTSAQFGASVSCAGDVNGDGFSDVVIGAALFDGGQTNEGRAVLYLGGPSGLALTPAWVVESNQAGAELGLSVAGAGDVNGDGYSDVVVGARLFDDGESDEGHASVYLGGPLGLAPGEAWKAESNQRDALFGSTVVGAGDVNGDGLSDVLVAAERFDDGETDEGRAVLFLGSNTGLSPVADWQTSPMQANSQFGSSVASVGDVNRDGFDDVVVGAPGWTNGEPGEGAAFLFLGSRRGLLPAPASTLEGNRAGASFGFSVAGVGDVNGDGFTDVAVGQPFFANASGGEGTAFVYLGSAQGLSPSPSWTAVLAGEPNAHFGRSVSRAGDINGDGFADILVGAPRAGPDGEGRAFLYLGSALGLSSQAAWTATTTVPGADFGASVASAGDVNADGFDDVMIGAPALTRSSTKGRVMLFLGGVTGLATSPSWVAESSRTDADFGLGCAGVGDVNGDGFADIMVGARGFENGQADEGAVFLYLGSAGGFSSAPSLTIESNRPGSQFGYSISGLGDVNGDGLSDVLIGEPYADTPRVNGGRVFLYLGSGSGEPLTESAWHADSTQAEARLGHSASRAGDVNGDGFTDVILSTPFFDTVGADTGLALAYLGTGNPWRFEQTFQGLVRPPGVSTSLPGALRGRNLSAHAPLLSRGQVEFEVKPLGVAFSGNPTQVSSSLLAGAMGSVPLSSLPPGPYKWRARVVTGGTAGRWVSFGGNLESQADFVVIGGPNTESESKADRGPASLSVGCGCQPIEHHGLGWALLILSMRRRSRRV